jgi:hypothetical protein
MHIAKSVAAKIRSGSDLGNAAKLRTRFGTGSPLLGFQNGTEEVEGDVEAKRAN